MGTNYFWTEEACPHCGRGPERLHIGKSSCGWHFALHVYPEDGLNNLADWQAKWAMPGSRIENEYGDTYTPDEMLKQVTGRSQPQGLRQHEVDGEFCVGNGPGTYDYMVGWFS